MTRAAAPPSPFPQVHGVDAMRFRMRGGSRAGALPFRTMGEFLAAGPGIPPEALAELLTSQAFRYADGSPVRPGDPYRVGFCWVQRPFPAETAPPEDVAILARDERLVVLDKPPFIAASPQGAHVRYSAQALARVATGLPTLCIAHRLDRLTAGVLLCTTDRPFRRAYQELFATGAARKTYHVRVHAPDGFAGLPAARESHIVKTHEAMQAREVPGAPVNAVTAFEVIDHDPASRTARIIARPATGRTHQIRVHLAALGAPVVGDPLYPRVTDAAGDATRRDTPLHLLAHTLEFTDPWDGRPRRFTTRRELPPLPPAP